MSKTMKCKRCGSLDLLDNKGMDAHSTMHGGFFGAEQIIKGHPIGAAIAHHRSGDRPPRPEETDVQGVRLHVPGLRPEARPLAAWARLSLPDR